jgi:hypothetical protein
MGYSSTNLGQGATINTYSSASLFPDGQQDGDMAIAVDTGALYYWDHGNTLWVLITASAATGDYKPQPAITLDSTDILNKYIVLDEAPSSKPATRLWVIGGPQQDYGVDFEITTDDGGKRLSWDGLGLELILEDGDKLIVTHN